MGVLDSVVGVDPGLSGGLTHALNKMDSGLSILSSIAMPVVTDVKNKKKKQFCRREIKQFLEKASPQIVIIEKVGAMPKQGVTSMFNFGYGAGLIEGICVGLGIPVIFVSPQAWQSKILADIPKTLSNKGSTIYCQRAFPDRDWRKNYRSRVLHDGMTDSACIAIYGLTKDY